MKNYWKILFATFLLAFSFLLYFFHYLIFKDAHHIFIYLLGDIAFVPISVLMVTLVLEHILEKKQKQTIMHKLNMVLGVFFSEVGTPLLNILNNFNIDNPGLCQNLQADQNWSKKNFSRARIFISSFKFLTDVKRIDISALKQFLSQKRQFLLTLLENPSLLEHEKITDMLWAIFHLTEELLARKDISNLLQTDAEHLSGDIKRTYSQLICNWLEYMCHLKTDYPYLYSLAVRTNPFNPSAKAEIS